MLFVYATKVKTMENPEMLTSANLGKSRDVIFVFFKRTNWVNIRVKYQLCLFFSELDSPAPHTQTNAHAFTHTIYLSKFI